MLLLSANKVEEVEQHCMQYNLESPELNGELNGDN